MFGKSSNDGGGGSGLIYTKSILTLCTDWVGMTVEGALIDLNGVVSILKAPYKQNVKSFLPLKRNLFL